MRNNGKCINSHAPKHGLKRYSAFRQNPIFLKDQNVKKNSNTISMDGAKLYQLHTETLQLLQPLNNLEKNRSLRNRESLQYKKKPADSVLLSLFMGTNG